MIRPLLPGLARAILLLVALSTSRLARAQGSGDERREMDVRVSFGHRGARRVSIAPRLVSGSPGLEVSTEERTLTVGAGRVEAVAARVFWRESAAPPREIQEIWSHLLEHGEPGQIARILDDPGRQPGAPVLTVLTASDETRGFSIGLEQLARHGAMWLPESDAYVTRADAPVAFATHLASLKGARVLDRVSREPEATRDEWTRKWEDFGDPTRWSKPWETTWLGARGHLTGLIARHGSLFKFGVDRWASVRPDHASPHRFRFDLRWSGCRWTGQRIVNGLPLLVTSLQAGSQRGEIEQFAAPLHDGPPARRGETASVVFSRVRVAGPGAIRLELRLGTESKERHPELREVAGRWCIVDRETGGVWLMIEPDRHLTVGREPSIEDGGDPRVDLECVGQLGEGEACEVLIKLPSPVVPAGAAPRLAALGFESSRTAVVRYWERWMAQGARFVAPEKAVNDLFRASLWHALFLPRHRTDESGVDRIDLPYSNFAYGQLGADWPINQAVYVDYMIHGLRGLFSLAEEELASMYRTQQKGDGRVSGYAEWGVYSPSMLYSIGQNFLLSRDRASFERLLPASLKALDWCLSEVARGKASREASGLIVAPLNDLTHDARAWAFPNAYFVAGLRTFGRALAAYGHPRAESVASVAEGMRAEVTRAFARATVRSPVVQLADGTWIQLVPCDALTPRRRLEEWYPTDVDCGPLHLARLDAVDSRGWLTTAMLHDHEDNLFLNQWGMANEPVYNPQATVYLRRDEPEAAIRAFYSMMACAFSHHQLTPLEHRWAWGQYTMPPSTDGAWFELYRNMLLNELAGEGTLFVGQAVPRAWLADGQRVLVAGAPTRFGPVNLSFASDAASERITARVEFLSDRRPDTLIVRLRHPDRQPLGAATVNGADAEHVDAGREWVRIPRPTSTRYEVVGRY